MGKLSPLTIDVETSKVPRHRPSTKGSFLVSLHLHDLVTHTTQSWLFNHPECTQSFTQSRDEIQAKLDSHDLLINQCLKFDMLWFDFLGLEYGHMDLFCTQVAQYIISGQRDKMVNLNTLCEMRGIPGKIDKVKAMWDAGFETDQIPANILVPYGEQDVICTSQVAQDQVKQLMAQGQWTLFRVQMEAMRMYEAAEKAGMKLDCETLAEHSALFLADIENRDRQILDACNHEIYNLNSPDQKSAMFFGGVIKHKMLTEEFKLLPPEPAIEIISQGPKWTTFKRTVKGLGFTVPDSLKESAKGTYSVDKMALALLEPKTKEQRIVLRLIADRSGLAKIRGTYLEGLQKKVQEDGCVHTTFKQAWTTTGRGSSEDPNLQNTPRDKSGPIKAAFVSRFT